LIRARERARRRHQHPNPYQHEAMAKAPRFARKLVTSYGRRGVSSPA
jgi:hypothetical protein